MQKVPGTMCKIKTQQLIVSSFKIMWLQLQAQEADSHKGVAALRNSSLYEHKSEPQNKATSNEDQS